MRNDTRSERHVETPDLPSHLSEAMIGDEVLVENILFPTIRATCRESGISVGNRLRVVGRRRGHVVVRNGKDGPLWLSDWVAYCIAVWKLRGDSDPVVVIGQSETGSTRWIGTGEGRRRRGSGRS